MAQSIAIIGAGIIGSSTAYYCTTHAAFTTSCSKLYLIEGSSIAQGASGKAGGLLALDWHGSSTASLASLSYRLHQELAKEHDGARRWGYRHLETLSVNAQVGRARTQHRQLGSQHEWLNADVLTAKPGVLGTKDTTSQAHPFLLTNALAEMAQQKGAELVEGTVVELNRDGGRFRLKLDNGKPLVVDKIVICAGPWTGRLAEQLNLDLGRANRVHGSRAHSIVLRPNQGTLPAQALFTSIKESGSMSEPEIYNRPDNTAYCCGPTDDSDLPPKASDVVTDPVAIASLVANVSHLSPLLSDSATIAKQACYLPVGSGDPVIGATKNAGIYVASGHSCWGICNGPGTGKVMSEILFEGEAKSADISALQP